MKQFLVTLVLLSLSFSSLGGDFQKGVAAANRGDFEAALQEWTPLAEKGNAQAQLHLGVMYENEKGFAQNSEMALTWYTLAAERGDAQAQANLGAMYASGKGVLRDKVYSHMWYHIASSNGSEAARKACNLTVKELTPQQRGKAQQLARECVTKDYKGC